MNKKFSTLLAAFAILGASASAQTLSTTVAEADSIVAGEYYYLGTGSQALSIVKTAANKDSLVLEATATPADYSALGNEGLWTVSKGATVALGDYFTFTNVSTGKSLKLALKGNGLISSADAAIDKFGWDWVNGTAKPLTYIAGGKSYTLKATAGTDSLSLSEASTGGIAIKPMVPAWRKMTAGELNEINADFFSWTVAGTTSTTAQAVASANAFKNNFTAKGLVNDASEVFYLQKKGSVKGADAAYLNVDTVYYTKTGALIDSTKANGGLVFGIDTLRAAYAPKAGKTQASFQFSVWTNVKDSIIIEVANIPTIVNSGETFATSTATSTKGYVTLVGFDGSGKALTASAPSTVNVLPTVTLGAGTKVELTAGAYYIYKKAADSVYVATLANTLSASSIVKVKTGYEKAWMPSTQWSLATTTNRPAFNNRETDETFGAAAYLYSTETANVYSYAGDTVKIVPVSTEGIYVGYKKMGKTAAEEAVTKLALQFHSALTTSTPYVYKATGDSILKVANMDKIDAKFFSVLPVDTFSFGADSLVAVAYKLYSGKDTLAYDATRKAYIMSKNDQNNSFIFRETTNKGWYQILPVDAATIGTAAWDLDGQVSASGTSVEVVLNSDLNQVNGYFSLEAPLEPEYATIEGVPAHKRIASVQNTTLAISMNSDSCGVLKAVSELKADAFTKQNFSMYMNVVDTDTIKPLYMISTQQTLALDSASLANDVRFFMGTINNGYAVGVDSVGFAKATLANDTLYVGTTKTLAKNASKYTYAFMKSATEGEYFIEAQANKHYLAQVNGVLCAYPTTEQALLFTVNAVANADIPTSNDAVSAEAVKVVAGQGQVTIAGAAGKKVVISNILGQAIANTVIASDNAVIAAPAGVVVVAVEGEEAVKAIVK